MQVTSSDNLYARSVDVLGNGIFGLFRTSLRDAEHVVRRFPDPANLFDILLSIENQGCDCVDARQY
jgi:hypothetical protein